MRSAEELHHLGVTAINAGRVAQARQLLLKALTRTQEQELLARIESSLAYCAAQTGDRLVGLELCAAALARPDLAVNTRGSIHGQRGLLLMLEGQTTEALEAFDVAIHTLADAPDFLGRAHLNRGGVFLQQDDPGRAEADFLAAAELLDRAGLTVEAAMAQHNLGYCRFLRGDLVDALRDMEEARPVLAPLSAVSEATCEQDRAEVLMAAGLSREGRDSLRVAARIYSRRRLHQRSGEAELALARSLLLSDPAEALRVARVAGRRFARIGRDAWRVRAEGVVVAAELELGRRGPGIVSRADRIACELEAQGLESNAALARLHAVRVLVRRGEYDEARARLMRVRVRPATPLAVRLLARTARVELAQARGARAAALREVRAGLDELHAWQSTFGSLDLQTFVVGRGRRLAIYGLDLAAASRRPEVVFEWSERARMLASRIRPVRAPADVQLAEDLTELRQLVGGEDGLAVTDQRRHDELRRQVRERALHHVGSGEVTDPCSLVDVQAALGRASALVAYLVTHGRVVALNVTSGDARTLDLGPWEPVEALLGGLLPDLDMAGSDLPSSFAEMVRGKLVERLDEISSLLVTPLLSGMGDRRVVLTPSGLLAGVPWGLLPGFAGRPVTVTRSATSWLGRQDRPLRLGSAGLVAGPRVARAEAEVLAAAAVWPRSEALRGDAATSSAVSDLAARVDVLHVSAHGRHSAENPMFSGLELVDGPWFGYDIDQLPEVPDVVLLSACEVGRSQVRYGDELIGMTTAWLHAGVRCVVASAAAVHDDVAHDVLIGVHRGLGAGLDPAEALAAALPAASEGAPPAPFVCFC